MYLTLSRWEYMYFFSDFVCFRIVDAIDIFQMRFRKFIKMGHVVCPIWRGMFNVMFERQWPL